MTTVEQTQGGSITREDGEVVSVWCIDCKKSGRPVTINTAGGGRRYECICGHEIHREEPTLLDMALAHEKPQWYVGETVWLVPDKVFLKNEDYFVRLNLVGYKVPLTVFCLDPQADGWTRARDVEKYPAWATKAKAWYEQARA